ncbi:MAG TPA: polymer-forming cytoskeletal protein [Smithella sp.]|nr:polymer-forming cytoskeletal protein [Smithella sp.]MDM7986484.1 polymer-forming cytoskeletal protein [Smithella sp.]HNY50246.1 polymer-forming cytoskeletal protein [Smithella sp.]HOG89921.1 polymer-forming cytoskeletal protein [Smithella sp.]HOU49835.1 polymer-forming cytoskeletal protein [Smithella sp.]
MWDKKKEVEDIKAFLGQGAEFEGKLIFNGAVRIDGKFQGEIFGQGSLVVGQGAFVKADIATRSVYISGDVQGKIDVKEKLNIHSTGKFSGDVRTPVFVMEEGAIFDGVSHMSKSQENETGVPKSD